jgi:O-6-methylguanine DNA methyltransferase
MTTTHTQVDSPCGPLTLVARDGGLAGLYMTQHRHQPSFETFGELVPAEAELFADASAQLKEYFAGQRVAFDLPLNMAGTPFQQRVWETLRSIPFGETVTYGQLAAELGQPTASRAVGLANGKNPVSIIVPCHRVVGSKGDLTGYGGGIERKRYLLDFEGGGSLFSPVG